MTKGNCIHPHTKLRAPLLRNRLCQAHHTCLRQRVIRLARIAVGATRAAHIHNRARFLVLDAEIRRGCPNQPEWRRVVNRQDGIPLFVRDLVHYAVPGITCVVDNVVDLAAAKLGGFLDQDVDVVGIGDVAGYSDGAVG